MREAQKIERLRSPQISYSPVRFSKPAELDEPGSYPHAPLPTLQPRPHGRLCSQRTWLAIAIILRDFHPLPFTSLPGALRGRIQPCVPGWLPLVIWYNWMQMMRITVRIIWPKSPLASANEPRHTERRGKTKPACAYDPHVLSTAITLNHQASALFSLCSLSARLQEIIYERHEFVNHG